MADQIEEGNERPRCAKCEHRRGVVGSAHSSCHHPTVQWESGKALLATLGGLPDINAATRLGVTCREYGLRSGWFAWPYNFDPAWLLTCSGFEEKGKEKAHG